jgi:mannose-1-phosphate guanylyltransferase
MGRSNVYINGEALRAAYRTPVQESAMSEQPGGAREIETPNRLWGIVLAGGEGARLRRLARRVCGEERPKQYVPLLGTRTLLGQTLDRVRLEVEPDRTVLVTLREHARYLAAEASGAREPHVLVQPRNRGTAAGILFPALWISWRVSDATVAVFPSDHFVDDERAFMSHIAEVAAWVDRHPDRIVLVGARPHSPEVEYGWIEPGEPVGAVGSGAIRAVRRFVEKPSEDVARACLAAGFLWNTMVIVAKTTALLEIGLTHVPAVSERLARIEAFARTDEEAWAVGQAYALIPTLNFSRAILDACPSALAVSELPTLYWSDLGTPRRVFELLRDLELRPSWLGGSLGARVS